MHVRMDISKAMANDQLVAQGIQTSAKAVAQLLRQLQWLHT
jgi:hypothetical protein